MVRNTPSLGSQTAVSFVQISIPLCKVSSRRSSILELMVTCSTQTVGIPTTLLSVGEMSEARSLFAAEIAQGGIYVQ